MNVASTPAGDDKNDSSHKGDKDAPGPVLVAGEDAVEESPPIARHFTLESQKEVTIRQVAPMVIVLTGATFLNASIQCPSFEPASDLEQTISAQSVVIILPSISRDLNIPETRQQWIVSAYALIVGSFLLLWGKLGDVYGKRLLFILGAFWFGATGLGAAFSPVEICMYIMRALQGMVSTSGDRNSYDC